MSETETEAPAPKKGVASGRYAVYVQMTALLKMAEEMGVNRANAALIADAAVDAAYGQPPSDAPRKELMVLSEKSFEAFLKQEIIEDAPATGFAPDPAPVAIHTSDAAPVKASGGAWGARKAAIAERAKAGSNPGMPQREERAWRKKQRERRENRRKEKQEG